MAQISLTGGCACGAYAPIMIVPAAGFSVTRGAARKFEVLADRGTIATRWHCGDCGSPLYGGGDGTVNLRAGSFDDPSIFQPAMGCHESRVG